MHGGGAAAWLTVNVWPAIVAVPVRAAPAFAVHATVTLPLPLSDARFTVSHAADDEAVQSHDGEDAVTATVAEPAVSVAFWLAGAIEKVQERGAESAPDWETVTVRPATVSVPVRAVVAVLASALKVTLPLPEPEAPAVTRSHDALAAAVQAQPAEVATSTVLVSPAAATDTVVVERVYVHSGAACEIVKVLPAIAIVPVRAAPVFAAALKRTDPLPLPLAPAVTVIHAAFDTAVHAQPGPAVTAIVPVPPAAGTDASVAPMENVHVGAGAGLGDGGGGGAGAGAGGTGSGAGTGTAGGGGAGAAAWLMATGCPAIVAVPERSPPPFAATRRVTEPLLVPLARPSIVIHAAWLSAVQAQPVSVSIVTATVVPPAGAETLAGATRYRHGAASCTMAISVLLTSTMPRRCTASALGATR